LAIDSARAYNVVMRSTAETGSSADTPADAVGAAEAAAREAHEEHYRWIALGTVLIGTFMVILDTTIVTVALDPIGKSLHSQSGVEWIVTAYLVAVGVVQPATGWLADRVGRKPVFAMAMAMFSLASLASALSPSLGVLIGARVVQGLGGGAMVPVGMAIIYELFPPERRGMAMGVWGVAAMGGPAIGPTLGGWLVTQFSWRWLFLVNVPIGAIGVLLALRILRNSGFQERRPFDVTGTVLIVGGLVPLLLALSEGSSWGWHTPQTLGLLLGGIVLIAAFVWWALTQTDHPLVDLRMFRISIFSLTIAVICLLTLSQYGRLVFIPLELESLRHLTPLHTGLLLTPTALGAGITMPIGGRLADRVGAKWPVTIGLIPVTVATWYLSTLTPNSSEIWLMVWLFVSGVGFGIAMMPNTVAGLNSLPGPLLATGSAIRQLSRQVAGSVAVAALTAVVTFQLSGHLAYTGQHTAAQAQDAYNDVFRFGFWALLATLVIALFLPGKAKSLELQRARTAEQVAMAEAERAGRSGERAADASVGGSAASPTDGSGGREASAAALDP
jgi:DHA2 family multidrug resistance protein